jgi:hypothetical protein
MTGPMQRKSGRKEDGKILIWPLYVNLGTFEFEGTTLEQILPSDWVTAEVVIVGMA